MGKFRIPSWLQSSPSNSSPSSPTADAGIKKTAPPIKTNSSKMPQKETPKEVIPESPTLETSRMIALAKKISSQAEQLEKFMRANSLPDPGFDVDSPGDFPGLPSSMQQCRQEIVYATKELNSLVRGPRESVRWGVWSFLDTLSLQIINNYGIAKLVPIDGSISLKDLQAKTSLDPINLARILRHAMTNYIFHEPKPGKISHTAASRMLAEDADLQAWVGFNSEDIFPAAANVLPSLKAYPEATSLTRTGFNFAFDTVDKEPMFVTFGKDPARAKRMGGAMASLTGGEGYEVSYLIDNYDLSDVNDKEGVFVDIGGSHGFVSVDLAKKWTKTNFIVQDLPKTVESAPKPIYEDESVASRIELQAHDFFKEQPVKGADVYFFRWILHNYSTPYAVQLLKNLVPALKPGARVVINDHCLRDPGSENPWDETVMRSMDMVMLALLNAQEREEHEFRALFEAADERFTFKGVLRVDGCRMSVVEAVWEPEKTGATELN